MRRRTVLAGSGVALTSLLGGCFALSSSPDDPPSLPSGMSVREAHVPGDVLPDSRERRKRIYDRETVHRLFTERDDATASIASDRAPDDFLAETDFEESFLLVVQYGTQSAKYLELDRVERDDDGLRFRVVTRLPPSNGSYADDLQIHTLFLAVTDPNAGAPEGLAVTVVDDP